MRRICTLGGKVFAKATQESIPYILTESCSSLKNFPKILMRSVSDILGISLIKSLRIIEAVFLT